MWHLISTERIREWTTSTVCSAQAWCRIISPAGRIADFTVLSQEFGDFRVHVLEEQVVACHVDMVLRVVHVVAAFQHLEKFRLAGVNGRTTVDAFFNFSG